MRGHAQQPQRSMRCTPTSYGGQNMLCRAGFKTHGEVSLVGARIAGDFDFAAARLTNDDDPLCMPTGSPSA